MLSGITITIAIIGITIAIVLAIFKSADLSNFSVLLTIMFATFPIFLTLYTSRVSEQKRREIEVFSKNRQDWINDLRKQIPMFLNNDSQQKKQEIYDYVYLLINGTEERSMLILEVMKLILDGQTHLQNKSNKTNNNTSPPILNKITSLKKMLNKLPINNSEQRIDIVIEATDPLNEVLLKIMQMNLKIEWERVKKGD